MHPSQDEVPRFMILLPQVQYSRADEPLEWHQKRRVTFHSATSSGQHSGIPLYDIHTSNGDFTRAPNLVRPTDLITFGDRLKITHRLEARNSSCTL